MTLRVLALSSLPSIGAGNRLRVEQYIPHLRLLGIELEMAPFFDDAAAAVLHKPGHIGSKAASVIAGSLRRLEQLWRAREYDLLLIYRESLPIGPPIVEAVWRRIRRPYVVDFDDALYLGPIHPSNRRWSWLRPRTRLADSVRGAAAVIVSTRYLAEWARTHNSDVTVLPTPVDTERYRPRPPHSNAGNVVIGWTGSSTTAPYLRILDEPLARLPRRDRTVVRVIGGTYSHPSVAVDLRPFTIEGEPADVATFDIGVLPQPDDPWTRGKAGFKALLYMATGLPVVASRVGVNPHVVVETAGYCVDSPGEWVSALDRLTADPTLRQRMGEAGRRHVEAEYALSSLAATFAEVLKRAAQRR